MTTGIDDVTRTWDMIENIKFCMLTTRHDHTMRARPMAAHIERLENVIYFLTDADSHKDEDIRRWPKVCLAFADSKGQKYVSLSGDAVISNDRERIEYLWSTPAKSWWSSSDDPSIRVLRVTPVSAEFWDSPGTVFSYIKMFAAAVSDSRPDMGDHAKVPL